MEVVGELGHCLEAEEGDLERIVERQEALSKQ